MMLKWSHATDITNMGQFNHHFFYSVQPKYNEFGLELHHKSKINVHVEEACMHADASMF